MPRVLVVDDEPDVADALRLHLRLKGYDATAVLSGTRALRAVKAERPHVILLDILMPMMDGFEVLRRIREIDQEVRVIVVTAVGDEEVGRRALALGASDFITKPVDLAYLELSLWVTLAPMLT
jgi:CheY-like chemotaxis protein